MKPIEEGCMALAVGSACPQINRGTVPLGSEVHVCEPELHVKAECNHPVWRVLHGSKLWLAVECALLRIDGYEGDDDEQVESLPLVQDADSPHACREN